MKNPKGPGQGPGQGPGRDSGWPMIIPDGKILLGFYGETRKKKKNLF